jgi:hypothetical protein
MKKKLWLLTMIALSALIAAVALTACNSKKITPVISAVDVSVEYDGLAHGVDATLSVQGGLTYFFTGVDNDYSSEIEPTQPGDYLVKISYNSADSKRIDNAEKTVTLKISIPYVISADGSEISAYSGTKSEIIIPSEYKNKKITSVGSHTFSGSDVVSIKFPIGAFDVKPTAFDNCQQLDKLFISKNTNLLPGDYNGVSIEYYDNLTAIRPNAYQDVVGLGGLYILETITSIGLECFKNSEIKKIVLPAHLSLSGQIFTKGLDVIMVYKSAISNGQLASGFFENSGNIKKVLLLQGIIGIGDGVFRNSAALEELEIESAISYMGNDVFVGSELKKIKYDLSFSLRDLNLPTTLTKIEIKDGVEVIQFSAFYACDVIEEVVLPASVISIDSFAFYGCTNLSSIQLQNGIETIGMAAFEDCRSLQAIELPNTILGIGASAFRRCDSLHELNLPSALEVVEESLFENCTILERIILPRGVKEIKDKAFYGCYSLETVTLSENLETIGNRAFASCVALTEVAFLDKIQVFETEILSQCINLAKIEIYATNMPTTNMYSFSALSDAVVFYVPSSIIDSYRSDVYWGQFNFLEL